MAPLPPRPDRDRGRDSHVCLLLVAFVGAPIAERVLGHGPNDVNTSGGLDPDSQLPVGPWTTVTTEPYPGAPGRWEDTLYLLGADQLGRDMFLRLLYGAQTSLEVAILATLLSVSIGLVMGLVAATTAAIRHRRLASDRDRDGVPLPALRDRRRRDGRRAAEPITFGAAPSRRVHARPDSIFGWFYPARIIRSQILSLREKEFIEAARMTGAGDWRIMRSHLLPHLVAPLIVYSTLIVATNVIAEAGLSLPRPRSWPRRRAGETCSRRARTTT